MKKSLFPKVCAITIALLSAISLSKLNAGMGEKLYFNIVNASNYTFVGDMTVPQCLYNNYFVQAGQKVTELTVLPVSTPNNGNQSGDIFVAGDDRLLCADSVSSFNIPYTLRDGGNNIIANDTIEFIQEPHYGWTVNTGAYASSQSVGCSDSDDCTNLNISINYPNQSQMAVKSDMSGGQQKEYEAARPVVRKVIR